MKAFEGFDIVLCRAEEAGNVGSACRAMKTMGFNRLVLADCPNYQDKPVQTFSVHAYDVYESAIRYPSLEQALAGCSLAAGFTRRSGKTRTPTQLDVRQFSRMAAERGGRTALVFGNERDGLSGEELALCDIAVRIPTSDAFPSLNLAQAVQIACWELSECLLAPAQIAKAQESPNPAMESKERIEKTACTIADDLASVGFFKITGRPETERFLRSLLARAGADAKDLEYFCYLFRKTIALSRYGKTALTPVTGGARVCSEMRESESPEEDKHAKN
jgi:tRNA/rRNA methyltransferase